MKKIISLILVLMMLVSACAMAAGKEITIGNVMLGDNAGSVIDFSGIELKFAAAANDNSAGVSVAAAAAGEDVVRVVLSADEAGAYLSADGISDVYSISMETIAELLSTYLGSELANLEVLVGQITTIAAEGFEKMLAIVEESMTEAGTQEISGQEYVVYDVYVSSEAVMEIYGIFDEFVALYPQMMEGTGYSSFTEMFESEGIDMTIDGQAFYGENGVMEDLYANIDGEAVSNVFASVEYVYYEDMDLNGIDIYVALYDPSVEDVDEGEIGYAFATVYTDPETEEFVMFDISVGAGDEDGVYAALNLGSEGSDEYKYFTVSTMDDAMEFFVAWGEEGDAFNVIVELTDDNEDVELQAVYAMPDDGEGNLSAVATSGEDEIVLSADITVTDSDGAWLPEIGETVDILTVDEDQINKLTMEAMGVLGKLISACSAASDDFAALMTEMM